MPVLLILSKNFSTLTSQILRILLSVSCMSAHVCALQSSVFLFPRSLQFPDVSRCLPWRGPFDCGISNRAIILFGSFWSLCSSKQQSWVSRTGQDDRRQTIYNINNGCWWELYKTDRNKIKSANFRTLLSKPLAWKCSKHVKTHSVA